MTDKVKKKLGDLKKIDRETLIMILFTTSLLKEYFLDGALVFIVIPNGIRLFSRAIDAVIYISIFVFVCTGKYTKKEIVTIVAGYLLMLVVCLTTHTIGLLPFWTWIILVRAVPYDKWIKVSLYCHCVGLAAGIIATVAGMHQDVIVQGRSVLETRYTFGMGQPNHTGNILFLIAACYCWLKEEKLNRKDYLLMAAITAIVYIFMNSQGTTIVMLVFVFVIYLFQNMLQNEKAKRTGLLILFYMSIAFAVLSVMLSVINVANISWLARMDKMISYRFTDAYRTLKVYGFSLFGQKIDFTELNTYIRLDGEREYYMDCMWIYLLSYYGIVFSIAFIYAYFSSMYRFVKKEKTMTVIIYFCGALYAMEQRIWPYLFGWVFMVFLAESLFQNDSFDESFDNKKRRLIGGKVICRKKFLAMYFFPW